MSDRWYVYHKRRRLGPWGSERVREALREGTVDAFDLVAREGSQLKVQLVQVDEIFNVSDADMPLTSPGEKPLRRAQGKEDPPVTKYSDPKASPSRKAMAKAPVQDEPTSRASEMEDVRSTQVDAKPQENRQRPATPPPPQLQVTQAIATDPRHRNPISQKKRSLRKDARKYFVEDRRKGQVGPLSAKEIQSLYVRGLVPPSAKVGKQGSKRKVPIMRFVKTYLRRSAQAKAKKVPGQRKVAKQKAGLPSSRVIDQMAREKRLRALDAPKWPFISLGFILAAIVLAYAAMEALDEGVWTNRDEAFLQVNPAANELPVEELISGTATSSTQPAREETRSAETAPKLRTKAATPQKATPKRPKAEARKVAKPKARPKPKPVAKEEPRTAPKSTKRSATVPTKSVQRPVAQPKPAQREVVQPKPVQRPAPQPQPQPVQRAATQPQREPQRTRPVPQRRPSGPIAALSTKIGQVTTVGPLSFTPAALANCGLKCELDFRDASGQTLKALFFKAQFEDQLNASGGSTTISGLVNIQDGKLVLYLQGVR